MMQIDKPSIKFEESQNGAVAKFTIEPLERGFGTTIGNARQGYMEWHEGGAVSNRVYFTQRGNYAESVSVSTTLTYPKNVSAAGGTVSPSRGTSYTITFTSGATYSGEPAGTTVDVSYSYSGGSATGFSALR